MGFSQATLELRANSSLGHSAPAGSPVMVHQDTALGMIDSAVFESQFVLATDDSNCVVGLIASEQILERLHVANRRERERWSQMPLRSLVNSWTASKADIPVKTLRSATPCTAVVEHDRLVGIALGTDIFLSWNRLEPMLSGAMTDPLTGLMNRLAYGRRLQEEWQRGIRTGCSVGIILIDIDHFKSINDGYDHQTGDEVIASVARHLEESLRSYDVVARYGGDEFVALCLGCRPGEIEIPMRRILRNMNALPPLVDGCPPVSVSVGAAVRHSDFATSDPAKLFLAADQCLYRAKESRNAGCRVEFGSEREPDVTAIRWQDAALDAAVCEPLEFS